MRPRLAAAGAWALIVGLVLIAAAPGCVTVDEKGNIVPPEEEAETTGPLLKKQIDKRIDGLKYLRGTALLDSLNWLILYGEHAVAQLLQGLEDPDPRTRSYCAYVLGEIGNQDVVPSLREALAREEHKRVRFEIAASLVTLGDWGQMGLLIEGLEEEARLSRHKCFEILRKNLNLTFGFDPAGPADERAAAVAKWKAWWERNRSTFTPVVK
ncbi:MAG: HEAT repeat domain-containing protein [Planctomycetes bacterium]|nr:HEAT repeat domain-containing protein [Planctomycetota bacterium]